MPFVLIPLIVIYAVGVVGLSIPATHDWFLAATPLNLLLTTVLLLWGNTDRRPLFFAACGLIYTFCFFIEVAGVHTKAIFGDYWYGAAMGPKMLQVPLLIGANWLVLVLGAAGMVQHLKLPALVRWALAATVMVLLDVLIEPIAMDLDFWQWKDNMVPLQNYIAWWFTSFAMQGLLHQVQPRLHSQLCTGIFLLQVAFFAAMHVARLLS